MAGNNALDETMASPRHLVGHEAGFICSYELVVRPTQNFQVSPSGRGWGEGV